MTKSLRWLRIVFLAWLMSGTLSAFATCGAIAQTLSPPPPDPLVITDRTDGATIYSGTLTIAFTNCNMFPPLNDGATYYASFLLPGLIGDTMYLYSSPNQRTGVDIAPVGSIGYTTTCPNAHPLLSANGGGIYVNYNSNITCSATLTEPLVLKLDKAGGPYLGSMVGWATCCTGNHAGLIWASFYNDGEGLANENGDAVLFSTIVLASCTVSPTNTVVNLPPASPSTLPGAGTSYGNTPFTLTLAGCPSLGTGNAYQAYATWSFTEGLAPDQIANTASSPAANVVTQIVSSGSTVTNGGTKLFGSIAAAGGGTSATLSARYYATGPVGPGNVQGVATYTLSYQ